MHIPSTESRKTSPWIIYAGLLFLGIGLSLFVLFAQSLKDKNTQLLLQGLDGMCYLFAIAIGLFFASGIAMLIFQPRLRTLAIATAILVVGGYGFPKLVRIESFYGNRTPRLAWRWSPTPEQRNRAFFTSVPLSKYRPSSDLFRPTPYDFPSFLGSARNARIDNVELIADWEKHPPKQLWRHPVGLGWSSFAVVGGVSVTLEQRDENECVVCYDVRTGVELWCHREATRFMNEHGDGPRTTPAIHKGLVVTMGGTGVLTCLDLSSGILQWKHTVFADPSKQNLIFGMSGSPLVFDEKVLITPGAGQGTSAILYSLSTGDELWRSGDDPTSYASPSKVSLGGIEQLLSFNGEGLRSYGLDGKQLWLHPWVTQGESRVNVAQPLVVQLNPDNAFSESSSHVVISSGYDNGTALLKISCLEDKWMTEVVWHSKHLKSKLSNFVEFEKHIYGLDNGILTCLDLTNGNRMWKKGRYGHGQILLVKDKLLIQAESGEVVIVATNPSVHQELTRFRALTSKTWNNPTVAGKILVVRNDREAAAFELEVLN